MPPSQQAARINLQELKAKLSKILGPDKESQYFSIFSRYLNQRLTKSELDRQVVLTIGKENIALHNQLVKAILYNAACPEPPLPPPVTDTSKPVKGIRRKPLTPSANSDETTFAPSTSGGQVIARSNGDAILTSPRKNRTGVRKAKERLSTLGLVKEEPSTSQGETEEIGTRIHRGAGIDYLRPVQHLQDAAEQPDVDSLGSVTLSLKRPRLGVPSQADSPAFDNRGGALRTSPSDEILEDQECTLWSACPVRPPLGIPFCVGSIGAAQQAATTTAGFTSKPGYHLTHSLLGDSLEEDCFEASDLPDGDSMRRRMERVAILDQGLQGVSHECGHLLNQALDVYLKRLIAASVELVQSRRKKDGTEKPQQQQQQQQQQQHQHQHQHQHQQHQQQQQHQHQHQHQQQHLQQPFTNSSSAGTFELRRDGMLLGAPSKLSHGLNGVWQPAHSHLQPTSVAAAGANPNPESEQLGDPKQHAPVSVLDFKVAMDANPELLGENRPLQLERIMLRVFEQQQRQVLQ